MHSNFDSDIHHSEGVHPHPACTVCLFQEGVVRQPNASVEKPYVIKAQETSFKDAVAVCILTVDPPGKIDYKFLKNLF